MTTDHAVRVGQFAWNTTTGQWRWDAGMFELHGYRPGAVRVDTDLVLAHKQDEHRDRAAAVLGSAARGDEQFSNYHHIVAADGRQRTVLSVGVSRLSSPGPEPADRISRGFMVDVTQDVEHRVEDVVGRVRRSMAPIAQAVGLVMGTLGLTEEAAFEVISRVSQHHNVKLHQLARSFMDTAVAGSADPSRDLVQVLTGEAARLQG